MHSARANFGMIAMSNFVYVYGGISGAGTGSESHHPVMSNPVVERYMIDCDKWDVL